MGKYLHTCGCLHGSCITSSHPPSFFLASDECWEDSVWIQVVRQLYWFFSGRCHLRALCGAVSCRCYRALASARCNDRSSGAVHPVAGCILTSADPHPVGAHSSHSWSRRARGADDGDCVRSRSAHAHRLLSTRADNRVSIAVDLARLRPPIRIVRTVLRCGNAVTAAVDVVTNGGRRVLVNDGGTAREMSVGRGGLGCRVCVCVSVCQRVCNGVALRLVSEWRRRLSVLALEGGAALCPGCRSEFRSRFSWVGWSGHLDISRRELTDMSRVVFTVSRDHLCRLRRRPI